MVWRRHVRTGLRWIVWLLLTWILLRGVVDIVAPPRPQVVQAAGAVAEPVNRQAAAAFAARFAREYLTWQPGQESDRAARLQPLLARHLDPQIGVAPGPRASQTADAALPVHTVPAGDGAWLVTVAAPVSTQGEAGSPKRRTLYLAVPVAAGGGGYAVHDYPALVPAPAGGEVAVPARRGSAAPDLAAPLQTLLNGFFKAYTAGTAADLAYFTEPGNTVPGLAGSLVFQDIAGLDVRRDGAETWAYATVTVADPVSGAVLRQGYTIRVVDRGGRWLVSEVAPKGA